MKFKVIAFILALAFVFASVSCNVAEPPSESAAETPLDSSSADTEQSSAPAYSEETEETEEPEAPPAPKKEYDRDEVYKHVFEGQSVKIAHEDIKNYNDDPIAGEGLVMIHLGSPSDTHLADYYIVKGLTTRSSDNCDKYSIVPNYQTASVPRTFKVTDDYHEAYLDVMFENLTFAECEKIPDRHDGVYELASISYEGSEIYEVRGDGHIYYTDGENCYISEQRVDAPYLCVMALARYSESIGILLNESEDIKSSCRKVNVTQYGTEYTYYVDSKGTAYEISELKWNNVPHMFTFTVGIVGMYAERATVHRNAEANGLLENK